MKLRDKKTGIVWSIPKMRHPTVQDDDISFFAMLGTRGTLFSYHSLAELNEEWEDVANIPLIKEDKIREIISAWAKVNDALVLKYNYDENSLDDIYRNTITFNMGLGLEDGRKYTIAELCGEEE